MTIETPKAAADLGVKLADLWCDEWCRWHVEFDGAAGNPWPWVAILEWGDEYDTPHHADWVTYTWRFSSETAEGALSDAVEWCEGLLPFKRCGECGGDGEYGVKGALVTCEQCGGSGLAHA